MVRRQKRVRRSQISASETQLHDQMALAVWNLTCPKTDTDGTAAPLTSQLKEWSKLYVDIQTISNASGTPSGIQRNGSDLSGGNLSGSAESLPTAIASGQANEFSRTGKLAMSMTIQCVLFARRVLKSCQENTLAPGNTNSIIADLTDLDRGRGWDIAKQLVRNGIRTSE